MKYPFLWIVCAFGTLLSCHSRSNTPTCKGHCTNGYGLKIWPDGSYLKGNFRGGHLNGYGIKHFGRATEYSGDTYVGDFKNDVYQGHGVYNDVSMDIKFSGEWQHGKPNGRGKQIFGPRSVHPGSYYIGEMKDGVFDGTGQYILGNEGARYVGHFLNGYKSGTGKFTWSDGRSYEGEWLNDQQHGAGTFTFEDGYQYKGMWTNGDNPEFQVILDQRDAIRKSK
jgi:1-phosphatidylinositol-4-phosphate 5-kinase